MQIDMKSKFLVLMMLLAISCKSPDKDLYKFDPRTLKENKITLSEIADDITYIPLDNSYPLGRIYNIKFINNTIYFCSKDLGVLAFDRKEKSLWKIGSVGRGPGEYTYFSDFTVDDKTETIYILDRGQVIKVYSKLGHYLKSFSLQHYGESIDAIEFYNSKLVVTYAIQFGNAKYEWIAFDTLGNVIKKKDREIPMFSANFAGREAIYRFENRISYWNQYSDTIFSILPDLSEEPSLIISPGEHRIPRSKLTMEQLLHSNWMTLLSIFETSRFHVVKYSYNKSPAILLIDKHNEDPFLIEFESDGASGEYLSGIVNDLDGGPSFVPETYFSEISREYMVGWIDPYKIKAHIASNEFKKSTPKYPEKKEELEELANSLKETDNPIIMVVRLKK